MLPLFLCLRCSVGLAPSVSHRSCTHPNRRLALIASLRPTSGMSSHWLGAFSRERTCPGGKQPSPGMPLSGAKRNDPITPSPTPETGDPE
jgi:hypothetical protein